MAKATEVFQRSGYLGASLADLTAAMGIASPSLYAAFGSKEALFFEALVLYREGALDELRKLTALDMPARDAIASWLTSAVRSITGGQPRGCLLSMTTLCRAGISEAALAVAGHGLEDIKAVLAERLRQASLAGEAPPGMDHAQVADFYHSIHIALGVQLEMGERRLAGIVASAMAAWDSVTLAPGGAASPIPGGRR